MFRPFEPLLVFLGIVLALQSRVAGVVPLEANPFGGRDVLAGLPALVGLAVAVEVDEYVGDNVTGVLLAREALVDLVDKGAESLLGQRRQRHVALRHVTSLAARADSGFRYVPTSR